MAKQLISASIDLTELNNAAKAAEHGAFRRGNNEHVYVSLNVWIEDEPNQYGHHASISLNASKEYREALPAGTKLKAKYIGNGKRINLTGNGEGGEPIKPAASGEAGKEFDFDSDLPF